MKMTVYRSITKPRLLVPIMHSQIEIDQLMKTISEHKPTMFIELGNWCGGMTLAIHQKFPKLEIYSFDLHTIAGNLYELFGNNVSFVVQDILKESSLIKRLLKSKDKKLLYCDNGNKIAEINLYAKYLCTGDVLGTDDYSERMQDIISNNFIPHKHEDGATNRFWTVGG